MRRVGITQRVEVIASYGERRDCLDQRWHDVATAVGCLFLPLPNLPPGQAASLIDGVGLDGVILSGGNDPVSINPHGADLAPERDAFEGALVDAARARRLPVLGVCRGMLFLNSHLGGTSCRIDNHVATEHALIADPGYGHALPASVNSYHNFAIPEDGLGAGLQAIGRDGEGFVEAMVHRDERLAALMWHPERAVPTRQVDIDMLLRHLS